MTATVTALPRANKIISTASRKPVKHRLARPEGSGVFGVSAVLLGLSLSHVAEGVGMITGSGAVAAWAMATGIEAGYVSLEMAMLLAPEHLRARVARFA